MKLKVSLRRSTSVLMLISSIILISCTPQKVDTALAEKQINETMDAWHAAAAAANYEAYFSHFAAQSIYIGTDATENWDIETYRQWSKPYFDRGQAWSFYPMERNVYIDETGQMAWFDELLYTWMKVCRGSGVLVKQGDEWKIKHYVLSTTIPNDNIREVIDAKAAIEDTIINSYWPELIKKYNLPQQQ